MAADPEVWILRHAEAEPSAGADGERRLAPAGEAAARALGERLAARGLRAARVLASPLARARRTAELVAAALAPPGGPPAPVVRCDLLRPGGDPRAAVEEALADGDLPCLLVGHNPDLELLVRDLTGEAIPLATAALVRIAFRDGAPRVLERP